MNHDVYWLNCGSRKCVRTNPVDPDTQVFIAMIELGSLFNRIHLFVMPAYSLLKHLQPHQLLPAHLAFTRKKNHRKVQNSTKEAAEKYPCVHVHQNNWHDFS